MKRFAVFGLALFACGYPLGGSVASGEAGALERTRDGLAARVNRERSAAGLEPFSRQSALDRAAQQAALDMSGRASLAPASGGAPGLSIELKTWLAEAGYKARRAAATAVVSDAGDAVLDDLLAPGRAGDERGSLFDPALRDLGIGLAGSGDLQVIVLVSALSVAGEFEAVSGPLRDLARVRGDLLEMSNSERRRNGRRGLERDRCLERVAQAYAEEMLAGSFYGHISPHGLEPFERARAGRCSSPQVAENLAQGPTEVAETIAGWMASPGHRASLLDREMTRVGFGVATGSNEQGFQILWVQLLGSS